MRTERRQGGFSLLEMLVALSILGLTLGALYQATSGATRNVRVDERYAFGVELARSLLADNQVVPLTGMSASGATEGGFEWRVDSARRPGRGAPLHDIEVGVSWIDGDTRREVVLNSVVEGARR